EGSWIDRISVSADGTLTNATLLTEVAHSTPLAAGDSYTATKSIAWPVVSDGAYRVLLLTDATESVYEGAGEDNNLRASDPVQVGPPALAGAILGAPGTAVSGSVVPIDWSVQNVGTAPGLGTWVDRVYLSRDSVFDPNDVPLGTLEHSGPLATGDRYAG